MGDDATVDDEEVDEELLADMTTAEATLRQPVHLPPKARFTAGKAVHVQFDGGS